MCSVIVALLVLSCRYRCIYCVNSLLKTKFARAYPFFKSAQTHSVVTYSSELLQSCSDPWGGWRVVTYFSRVQVSTNVTFSENPIEKYVLSRILFSIRNMLVKGAAKILVHSEGGRSVL